MIEDTKIVYICSIHEKEKTYHIMSPCRALCRHCKKKKVNGYENPDHVSNPFGYLYLFPSLCDPCAETLQKCKWCVYTKSKLKK